MGSLLLMLALIGVYSLINIVVSQRIVPFGPRLGAIVANGLLIALYLAGGSGLPIFGHGKGELAPVTFFGTSLAVAGVRAAPGCEVMAIPNLLFPKTYRAGVSHFLTPRRARAQIAEQAPCLANRSS